MSADEVKEKKVAPKHNSLENQDLRQAILVLGMHRSGTSALAGMLVKLGAVAPKNLIKANKNNPKGYWESMIFKEFHDHLLESGGTAWHDWRLFDSQWFDSPGAGAYSFEWEKLFLEEYGDSNLLVIKDPRICRIVPFWFTQLDRFSIEPKSVLIFRSPLEVASSLYKRNGFSMDHSLLLWLRHVLEAEAGTRGNRRSIVKYSELINDWQKTVEKISLELDIKWPVRLEDKEKEIDSFISADLRINEISDEAVFERCDVFNWVKSIYRALNGLNSGELSEIDFESEMDQVKSEFDQASTVFGSIFSEIEGKMSCVTQELENKKKEAKELRDRLNNITSLYEQQKHYSKKINAANSTDIRKLTAWLDQLDRYMDILFQSNRWKLASMFGGATMVLRGQKRKLPSAEAIKRIMDQYRKWEPSGREQGDIKQLSKWIIDIQNNYKALMKSKSWNMGTKIVSILNRVLLRKQNRLVTRRINQVFKEFNLWQQKSKSKRQIKRPYNFKAHVSIEDAKGGSYELYPPLE